MDPNENYPLSTKENRCPYYPCTSISHSLTSFLEICRTERYLSCEEFERKKDEGLILKMRSKNKD